MRTWLFILVLLLFVSCEQAEEPPAPSPEAIVVESSVPLWAKHAIWYQIFVERFRNGDPANDPTLHDIEGSWPHAQPAGWEPTPWTHDWYAQEDWAKATGEDFYYTVQVRRYGGDLQGVLDRLDYLEELGVTALYLNPINDAPSLHKYDARTYRHIDRNFGPDPRGDEALMAAETPTDPATWQWTAADSLFLHLIDEVHRRGMRIIIDYSWNHTGITFWAWQDVLEKQQDSPYADWYEIEQFDDPNTPENEFAYSGWAGVRELPELKKVGRPEGEHHGAIEGNLHPDIKQHVFNVTRRWLDPNGDGDPADGVDGFRLDVAEMVPLGFWREYRSFVRGINPQAYLVGEVWWEVWPETMYDAAPWLQGDVFDAVMNYRWYMPTRSFFADTPPHYTPSQYLAALDAAQEGIPYETRPALMNLTASHDTPRFSTSIYNPGRYKFEVNPRENLDYKLDKPDDRTKQIQRLMLVQQFTHVGAPHIWNGDEVGMWGADDPDNRKPLVWSDRVYEDETALPFGGTRQPDTVKPDTALFNFYKQLIAMRRGHPHLYVEGKMHPVLADDERGIVVYERVYGDQHAIVAFNVSSDVQEVTVPAQDGYYNNFLQPGETLDGADTGGALEFSRAPLEAKLWLLE